MTLLDSALEYVNEGFAVFPVKPDKTPLTKHGLKDATRIQAGVRDYWTKWPDAGIGLVTDGLVVLDFDAKNGGRESLEQLKAKYEFPPTRTHRTGGGGLHFLYHGNCRNTVNLGGYKGVDLRGTGGYIVAPPSPHVSGHSYKCLNRAEIAPAPEWLLALTEVKTPIATGDGSIIEGERNATLASLAGTMRRRGMPLAAIEAALREMNASHCDPPLPDEDVQTIAQSVSRYEPTREHGSRTGDDGLHGKHGNDGTDIRRLVDEFVDDSEGWLETRDIWAAGSLQSRADKQVVWERLREHVDAGRLKRKGQRYRRIDKTFGRMVLATADPNNTVNVKWPFSLEKYCTIFPKNVIIIEGVKSAGKTAFLMNFCRLNLGRFHIRYINSDMGAEEFHLRVSKMKGITLGDWDDGIELGEPDGRALPDLIVPDAVNIVDYLEVFTDFFAIGGMIKELTDEITTGILIVAIQKNKNSEFALGGERVREKAKLVVQLNKGQLRLAEVKNWGGLGLTSSPTGLAWTYQTVDGANYFNILKDSS